MKKLCLIISNSCPSQCKGCVWGDSRNKEKEVMNMNQIEQFLDKLQILGYEQITLAGGDPLLREEFLEILSLVKKKSFKTHVDTTGLPFLNETSNYNLDKLSSLIDLIGIPLDGSSDEIIRMFRTNTIGTIERTKKILGLLNSNNFKISINTVVHKYNTDDLENIYKIIIKYKNIKRWELHQFSKHLSDRKDCSLTQKDFEYAISRIQKQAKGIELSVKTSSSKYRPVLDINGDLILGKKILCTVIGKDVEFLSKYL